MAQKEYYTNLLKDIEAKRKELDKIPSKLEKKAAIKKIEEALKDLETTIQGPLSVSTMLKKQEDEIEFLYETYEEELKHAASKYEGIVNDYKKVLKEQKEEQSKEELPSNEEIRKIQANIDKQKIELNKKSLEVKKEIKQHQEALKRVKKKKKKIKNKITTAEALGLSVDEYLTIESTLKNQEILRRILGEKGLDDLVSKKKSDLTKEEKQELKEAHNKIIEEISEFKASESDKSVIDAIQSLYNIEDLYVGNGSRTIKMRKQDIKVVAKNAKGLPEKVRPNKPKAKANYVPSEAPSDMRLQVEETPKREPVKYVINLPTSKTAEEILNNIFDGLNIVTDSTYKDVKADSDFITEMHSDVQYNVVTRVNGRVKASQELKSVFASNMKKESENVKALISIYDSLDRLSIDDIYLLYREYNKDKLRHTKVATVRPLKEEVNKAVEAKLHSYNSERINTLYSSLEN